MSNPVGKVIDLSDQGAAKFCLRCGGGFVSDAAACADCGGALTSREEIEQQLARSAPEATPEDLRVATLESLCVAPAGGEEVRVRALLLDAQAPHLAVECSVDSGVDGGAATPGVEFLVAREDLDFLLDQLESLLGLTVVQTFSFTHEAELARTTLTAADIWCALVDAETIHQYWLWSNALGNVKLVVRADDVDAARKALAIREHEPGDPCPECGGRATGPVELNKRAAYVGLLIRAPVIPIRRRWRCNECGALWK